MTDARAEHLLFCCEAAKAADNSEATIYRWELEELLAAREEAKGLREALVKIADEYTGFPINDLDGRRQELPPNKWVSLLQRIARQALSGEPT